MTDNSRFSDGPVGRLFGFSDICPDCGKEVGDHIYCGEGVKARCPTVPAPSRRSPDSAILLADEIERSEANLRIMGIFERFLTEEENAQVLAALRASQIATPTGGEVDLTNHHNALKCPYCNPQGLEFAPAQSSAGSADAVVKANQIVKEMYSVLPNQWEKDCLRDKIVAAFSPTDGAATPREPVAWRWHAPGEVRWTFGAYPPNSDSFVKEPLYVGAAQPTGVREALELAEDVLSRAPFSTDIWPNGVHPNTGIKKIRDALSSLPSTDSEGK